MSLLEDVMVNAKAAVNAVGQTAGKLVDISKLRYSAGELNSEISKRYEALGRVVYDSVKTGNNSPELVKECVEVIEKLYEQLDTVNDQISVIKNRIKCKNCGFENAQEAAYCSRCGVKLAVEPPVEEAKEEKAEEPAPEAQAEAPAEQADTAPVEEPSPAAEEAAPEETPAEPVEKTEE